MGNVFDVNIEGIKDNKYSIEVDLLSNDISVDVIFGAVQIDAGDGLTKSVNTLNVGAGTGISVGADSVSVTTPLAAIANLTPAADRIAYYTNGTTASLATLTSFARTLLDDANNTAARTTLGLGTIATQNSNNVSITGGTIDGITIDGGTF